MKISARNQLKGTIQNVQTGAVNGVVTLKVGDAIVTADITNHSIEQLGLQPGKEAYALVKATSVMVGTENGEISARNQLKGKIENIQEGAVNAVVTRALGDTRVKADITMDSVKNLGLSAGKEAYAIIKASSVMFATDEVKGISARNQLKGTITEVKEGAVNGHVTIELEDGNKIKGSITNEAIEQLGLKEGGEAVAIIKATEVMVGVE